MLRKILGCFALLLLGTFTAAHATDAYKLKLAVTRNGMLIGKPSIEVLPNRDADLIVTPQGGSKEDAVRVLVSVAPAAEQNVVGVHVMIFDRNNGEWALRAEPSLKAKLNKDVSLTVGTTGMARVASPIEVSVNVAQATVTDETSTNLSRAPSDLDLAIAPAQCNCCTAGHLQCCNVVSCCDDVNGACCSPPCHRVEAERNLTRVEIERRRLPRVLSAFAGISAALSLRAPPAPNFELNGA